MAVPSGENTGSLASPTPDVICLGAPEGTRAVQTSPPRAKTTDRESEAQWSDPASIQSSGSALPSLPFKR